MRIGVDGRALVAEGAPGLRQPRGIARYASNLLAAMVATDPEHDWRVLLGDQASEVRLPGATLVRPTGSRRVANATAALVGRPRIDGALGGGLDVMWLPAPAPVAVSPATPYVLTVHDLSTQLRRGDFSTYARVWGAIARPRRLAERAAGVIVDARDTATQVQELWGLPPGRITVVQPGVWRPPAAGPSTIAELRRRLRLPERFLLFVGALEPRKGLDVLLDGFARARDRGLGAGLVLVGDGPLRARLSGPGVTLTGRLSDPDLAALYWAARATVLPSLLEGFGFTPLESLAAGTPAVTSDLPSIRETLGDAGLFVPPGDPAALAEALLKVDGDEALRARLVTGGNRAVDALSWERAAGEALSALRRAARG